MITSLDRPTALVVVDLQRGTMAAELAEPTEPIVARAAGLIEAFRSRGLPVAIVTASGVPHGANDYATGARELPAGWDELDPSIRVEPDDIRISKTTWSAFAGTPLDDELRARGVTAVVIVGLATTFGIESTARAAYDLGYNVVVPVDVTTDVRPEAHAHAVTRVFPVIAQTGLAADILPLLDASGR